MKNLFKRLAQALLVLRLILAALALWKREEVTRLLAVNTLFDDARIVENFSHMDRMFLTRSLPRGDGPASALPPGTRSDLGTTSPSLDQRPRHHRSGHPERRPAGP